MAEREDKMINLMGWIGNIGFIFGAIFLARKHISGWYFQILGNACYIVFGFLMGVREGVSIIFLSILLLIINIIALKKWKENKWINIKK